MTLQTVDPRQAEVAGVSRHRKTARVRAVLPLQGEPRFRPFQFGLPLEGAVARAVADARDTLARTPGRFDGPIAFCHGVTPDGAILRRAGRYAEAMVVFQEPSLAYRLGFALGVQLFVERSPGVFLFQLRGRSIGRDPLLWTASASGGVMPGEDARAAVLADAAEEIGLREDDLLDLRPVGVVVNDDTGSALVVYRAGLRDGAEPTPDELKVAELHWASAPGVIGAQVSGDTLAAWDALQMWRETAS
jgi:NUDIX domain